MDAGITSYESMLAAQEAARWAFWAMLGVWFSGVITLGAVCIAKKALTTWREQYIASLKGNLIASLVDYSATLRYCPERIKPIHEHDVYVTHISGSFFNFLKAWRILKLALNENKKKNEKYISEWVESLRGFQNAHCNFMEGKCTRDEIGKLVASIYTRGDS